jgi:D-glycero-alpha-D-manno-heptose-7-phosphate kinase
VVALDLEPATRHRLEDDLLLFYTGIRRSASDVLAIERGASTGSERDLNANLDAVKALGRDTAAALERGDLAAFGQLLTAQWQLKLDRSPTPVHQQVDEWIRAGIAAGAAGGKLVGAGDGGFLLFQAESKTALRAAMRELDLEEVRFGIDYHGSSVIVAE